MSDPRSTEAGLPPHETLERRIELKLSAPEAAAARLRAHLRLVPTLLRTAFPPRTVQSVYLDTPARAALDDCRDGVGERRKLRLRWYGDEDARVAAVLESKAKAAGRVTKRRVAFEAPVAVAGRPRDELVRALREASGWWLPGDLEPSQWIVYRREYLVSASGEVRVTLDTRLFSYDLGARARVERGHATRLPRLCIVEVKATPAALDEARRVLCALPLRAGRCSKYALACDPGAAGPLVDRLGA